MHVISVLSVLLVITYALANKTEIKNTEEKANLKDSQIQELDAISATIDAKQDKEVKRAKKSTTTTFCVEIRPSGPFQKPFQVCEPAEPAKAPQPPSGQTYSAPAATSYYPSTNYGAQEQPKPEPAYSAASNSAYKSNQPKSGAVYSAPVKTYSPATTQAPKQYAAHGMSFASYRSKSEDADERSGHLMRMTHDSAEEDPEATMVGDHQMRSASYGMSNYGSPSYGGSTSYVPVVPKRHLKRQNHNGLVITCQPNLAGYAHNVPSSLHHPPAVPHYSYRSSTPGGYDRRYGRYQVQSHAYGNYQQPPHYKQLVNGYKSPHAVPHQLEGHQSESSPSAPSRQNQIQQYGSAYGSPAYAPPEPVYAAPVYKSPPASVYSSPPRPEAPPSYALPPSPAYAHPSAPAPAPQTPPLVFPQAAQHAQPAQSAQSSQAYSQYTQSYAQAPSAPERGPSPAYQPAPAFAPAPALAPALAPAPAGYASVPAPSSYSQSQSQSYSSNPPSPAPQPQPYATPGTYREADDERMQAASPPGIPLQEDKEKHTLKKMEEVLNQRVMGTQWAPEMTQEKKNNSNSEHVESTQWASLMRASEKGDGMKIEPSLMKHGENNLEAENEVE